MNEKFNFAAKKYSRFLRIHGKDILRRKLENQVTKTKKLIDDSFHISAVKHAQRLVTDAEQDFLSARKLTGDVKYNLEVKETALDEAKKKVDRCPRENFNYLTLVSEEHAIQMEVQELRRVHKKHEGMERDSFTAYSNAVRFSHEKERERAQKTKYWSIIGSISGTVIGFFGSSLITYYRIKQLKEIASPDIVIKTVEQFQQEIKDQNSKNFENTSKIVEGLSEQLRKGPHFKEFNSNDAGEKSDSLELYRKDFDSHKKDFDNYIKEGELRLAERIDEKSDYFIQNTSKLLEDFQRDIKVLFDEKKHEFRNNIGQYIEIQKSQFQDFSTELNGIIKNQTTELQNVRDTVSTTNRNEIGNDDRKIDVDLPSDSSALQVSWKEDLNLGIAVASLAFLVYLTSRS